MARPMANDPPFATLNHFAGDLGIPSESDFLRIGISSADEAKIRYSRRSDRLELRVSQRLIGRACYVACVASSASTGMRLVEIV
jgi:hypothetical protein